MVHTKTWHFFLIIVQLLICKRHLVLVLIVIRLDWLKQAIFLFHMEYQLNWNFKKLWIDRNIYHQRNYEKVSFTSTYLFIWIFENFRWTFLFLVALIIELWFRLTIQSIHVIIFQFLQKLNILHRLIKYHNMHK